MIIRIRNRINHVILNMLLVARYHVRRRPGLIRCLLVTEAACVKLGVIFYSHKMLHQ